MQGMAGTLMLLAALTLWFEMLYLSCVFQGFVVLAFALLLFGKFCLGAYIYHFIKGKGEFANATCPWSKINI
jgi:hypothetical protein